MLTGLVSTCTTCRCTTGRWPALVHEAVWAQMQRTAIFLPLTHRRSWQFLSYHLDTPRRFLSSSRRTPSIALSSALLCELKAELNEEAWDEIGRFSNGCISHNFQGFEYRFSFYVRHNSVQVTSFAICPFWKWSTSSVFCNISNLNSADHALVYVVWDKKKWCKFFLKTWEISRFLEG